MSPDQLPQLPAESRLPDDWRDVAEIERFRAELLIERAALIQIPRIKGAGFSTTGERYLRLVAHPGATCLDGKQSQRLFNPDEATTRHLIAGYQRFLIVKGLIASCRRATAQARRHSSPRKNPLSEFR